MIDVGRMWTAWLVSRAIPGCGQGSPRAETQSRKNRTLALGGCVAGNLMRALASILMLNATFPFDALAQTPPPATAQPAAGQQFNPEQLDALLASIALTRTSS